MKTFTIIQRGMAIATLVGAVASFLMSDVLMGCALSASGNFALFANLNGDEGDE
jgi:hypothetical protein